MDFEFKIKYINLKLPPPDIAVCRATRVTTPSVPAAAVSVPWSRLSRR